MVRVKLVNVVKKFGNVIAVKNVSFEVEEGELFTLLGPSGCGKTTTLRLIAGFYTPDEGEIYFDDELVNDVPPHKRGTGMVFQNYALWPHMKVFDNIAYGLKLRNLPPPRIIEKVKNIIKFIGLEGKENRFPSQLSGGEQQRVALARALVIEPKVLLLDEPLSNLDAKLRLRMRTEIRRIQKQLKITTVYVTHDQEEALSISDRIAVMNKGEVLQIGTPREIYESPSNIFVADFIGVTNFIPATVLEIDKQGGKILLDIEGVKIPVNSFIENVGEGGDVICAVRPESISLVGDKESKGDEGLIRGKISMITYLGKLIRLEIETLGGNELKVDLTGGIEMKDLREGKNVALKFNPDAIRIFIK